MKISKFFIPIIIVLGVTAFQSIFIVQEINQAIVLQFGDPKKIVTKDHCFGCTAGSGSSCGGSLL